VDFSAFKDLTSQLSLFASAQCKNIAVRGQNEKMIVAGHNRDDFLGIAGFVAKFEY